MSIISIIAEENELIRRGLKNALAETDAAKVIDDCASVEEMPALLHK